MCIRDRVIPLLQITPSKTDKERLLVISPELAAVFAEIIHYVRNGSEQLPLVHRYDQHERLHSPALPFLFQRRWGVRDIAINHGYVKDLLGELLAAAGIAIGLDRLLMRCLGVPAIQDVLCFSPREVS